MAPGNQQAVRLNALCEPLEAIKLVKCLWHSRSGPRKTRNQRCTGHGNGHWKLCPLPLSTQDFQLLRGGRPLFQIQGTSEQTGKKSPEIEHPEPCLVYESHRLSQFLDEIHSEYDTCIDVPLHPMHTPLQTGAHGQNILMGTSSGMNLKNPAQTRRRNN